MLAARALPLGSFLTLTRRASSRLGRMSAVRLSPSDERMLSGGEGEARRLSMRIIVAVAEAGGAASLIDVGSAHVDGCLYQGQASLDFAERMAAAGAEVAIPTTLNVS